MMGLTTIFLFYFILLLLLFFNFAVLLLRETLNYNLIDNVILKLSIGTMSFPSPQNYQNIDNIPHNENILSKTIIFLKKKNLKLIFF
jgi:hypothetical protein